MTQIAEHESKEERKCDHRVRGWISESIHWTLIWMKCGIARINLEIIGNPVSVNNVLEAAGEFVCTVECGWLLAGFHSVQNWRDRASAFVLKFKNKWRNQWAIWYKNCLHFPVLKQVGFGRVRKLDTSIRQSDIFVWRPGWTCSACGKLPWFFGLWSAMFGHSLPRPPEIPINYPTR